MRGLRGKVVLFEFWTFCCINCHHNIGEVRRLQEKFGDALVVIGVHSAKFEAEKIDPGDPPGGAPPPDRLSGGQ